MSMNKRKYIYIVLLSFLFIFLPIKVNANTLLNKDKSLDCSSFGKQSCEYYSHCDWIGGSCTTVYVVENACEENDIKKVLQLFGYILLVAKVMVPLIIIALGTFDLFKSVVDKDEKSLGKQVKQLGLRLLAGFVVFFVPNIVYAVFSLSDSLNIVDTSEYKACAECVFEPGKCNVN